MDVPPTCTRTLGFSWDIGWLWFAARLRYCNSSPSVILYPVPPASIRTLALLQSSSPTTCYQTPLLLNGVSGGTTARRLHPAVSWILRIIFPVVVMWQTRLPRFLCSSSLSTFLISLAFLHVISLEPFQTIYFLRRPSQALGIISAFRNIESRIWSIESVRKCLKPSNCFGENTANRATVDLQ